MGIWSNSPADASRAPPGIVSAPPLQWQITAIDPMSLKLLNTLTNQLEPFSPAEGDTVRMYSCGPTVYNYVHIGNLRTFVFEDILRRHLASKWTVKHVMNVTDIDDKIIKRSMEAGKD